MDPRVKDKRRGSIIIEVIILFALSILLTGLITHQSQLYRARSFVTNEIENRAKSIADEVSMTVKEYPAYEWLLDYWCEHAGELNIHYDDSYIKNSWTGKQERLLLSHQPDLSIKYADTKTVEALPPGDQKLYAEVTYSWLLTRINQIKRMQNATFLFCVRTEEPYTHQFFVFSAADPGAVRGTEYNEVYTLGVEVDVNESLQESMKSATETESYVADAGDYVDYYQKMISIGDDDYLIGLSYDSRRVMANIEQETKSGTIMSMIYQLLLSLIISVGLYFLVLKPLRKVQENIRLYKNTKDSKTVTKNLAEINLNNEIGELATDVSDLAKEIDEHLEKIGKITAEKERIQTELSLAQKIQSAVLPHIFPPFPERKEFDIFAMMEPAREVGGDFYDFYLVDDDHLCVVMADVSGKGVPGALFMMVTKSIIKSFAMMGLSPAEILEKTNETICSDNSADMFVTAWIGILEISTGRLTASNAGHEYPVLKHRGGSFELYKDKHGFVLGGMEGMKYTDYELQMGSGSKLFVHTDGVPEATASSMEMFGAERMMKALNSDPDADTETVLGIMKQRIVDFVAEAEQFDDITMLCLEYK